MDIFRGSEEMRSQCVASQAVNTDPRTGNLALGTNIYWNWFKADQGHMLGDKR